MAIRKEYTIEKSGKTNATAPEIFAITANEGLRFKSQ